MVVLSPQFALLASFAAIAAFWGLPEARGAAIHDRAFSQGRSRYGTHGYSRRFAHAHTRTRDRRQGTPVPLPDLPFASQLRGAQGDKPSDPTTGLHKLLPGTVKRHSQKVNWSASQASKVRQHDQHTKGSGLGLGELTASLEESVAGLKRDSNAVSPPIGSALDPTILQNFLFRIHNTPELGPAHHGKRHISSHDGVGIHLREDIDEGVDFLTGTVDIMSSGPDRDKKIASLAMPSHTSGYESGDPIVLDASDHRSTVMYLAPTNSRAGVSGTADPPPPPTPTYANSTTTDGSASPLSTSETTDTGSPPPPTEEEPVPVMLLVPVSNREDDTLKFKLCCATYYLDPKEPHPMTVEECTPDQGDYKSQTFFYYPSLGGLTPTWHSSGGEGDQDDNPGGEGSSSDSPGVGTTPSQDQTASSMVSAAGEADPGARNATAPPNARSVTMKFSPLDGTSSRLVNAPKHAVASSSSTGIDDPDSTTSTTGAVTPASPPATSSVSALRHASTATTSATNLSATGYNSAPQFFASSSATSATSSATTGPSVTGLDPNSSSSHVTGSSALPLVTATSTSTATVIGYGFSGSSSLASSPSSSSLPIASGTTGVSTAAPNTTVTFGVASASVSSASSVSTALASGSSANPVQTGSSTIITSSSGTPGSGASVNVVGVEVFGVSSDGNPTPLSASRSLASTTSSSVPSPTGPSGTR